MKVSFCKHNEQGMELYKKIKDEHEEIEVSLNKCIGECSKCGRKIIVRIDGKLIEGETSEEVYNKILTYEE